MHDRNVMAVNRLIIKLFVSLSLPCFVQSSFKGKYSKANDINDLTFSGLTPNNKHPNVLLIVVDDLRPIFGCYGDTLAKTTEIDKIAQSGVVFTKAYAQQALCGPSRTSFLTSRRPDTTQLIDVHYYWRFHSGNFTTLPQFFKEHGYQTVSVGKVFHPGITSNHSDDELYSWTEQPYHPSTQKYKNAAVCSSSSKDGKLHSNIYCPIQINDQPEKSLPDIQTTKYVFKWLRKFHRQNYANSSMETERKSFFLAVGFHKPHIPLKFPAEFLDLYPIDKVPLAPNRYLPVNLPLVAWNPWNDMRRRDDITALNISYPFGPIPDDYSRYIRQGYYAATSYVDSLIGLVSTEIQRLFPDTIVALVGDHGISLGEHQEWSKFSNFEVSTNVPFIITRFLQKTKEIQFKYNFSEYFHQYISKNKNTKLNKVTKRQHKYYDGFVELLDLFPTLVDLAGLSKIPRCPSNSKNILLCTEGTSLSCIIHSLGNYKNHHAFNSTCSEKKAALSQYPRPDETPSVNPDSDQCSLLETKIMGYSLRINRFRYTTWLAFNSSNFTTDWSNSYGEELYDHKYDPEENENIVTKYPQLAKCFFKYLRYFG